MCDEFKKGTDPVAVLSLAMSLLGLLYNVHSIAKACKKQCGSGSGKAPAAAQAAEQSAGIY